MFDRNKLIHISGMLITLAALWLLLSGYFKPLLLFFGLVSIALVLVISLRMELIEYDKPDVLRQTLRSIPYGFWLLVEIFKANIDVCKRILNPSLPISPRLVRITSTQRGDLARTAYANSITLTPGTISIDVEGKEIEVHALAELGEETLATGEMDRRITAVEDKGYV